MSARLLTRNLALLLLFAVRPVLAAPPVAPTVKFVLEEGAKVADITRITVKATSTDNAGIDKVEFYVDDQLKFTDTSVPYEFDWDTLAESEGTHTLSATAFDGKGNTAKARISITIDNELGKGADAHADTALEKLKAGDTAAAERYARRALKIDPGNLKAARAYAGVLLNQGEPAKAIAVLEKAKLPDDDTAVRSELIRMHMAHGDAADSTDAFLADASSAVEIYKKVAALRVAASKSDDKAEGDALFSERNWSRAISSYQKCGQPDEAPIDCANRLVLAQISAGKTRDAEITAHTIIRAKRNDLTTDALYALVLYRNHDLKKARETVQSGVDSRNLASLIVAGYIDMALKEMKKARAEADAAMEIAPDLAEVQLLQAYTNPDSTDARKASLAALEANPTLVEAYTQRAFQIMLNTDKNRFEAADQMLDFASRIDAKNPYVLTARAMSFIGQRRPQEAEPLLTDLIQAEPNAPELHTAYALNLSLLDKTLGITREMNTALKLDPERWNDLFVPKPQDLIKRVYYYRFYPVLTPAALYPKQA